MEVRGPISTRSRRSSCSVAIPTTARSVSVDRVYVYAHYSEPFPTLVAWYGSELLETVCG